MASHAAAGRGLRARDLVELTSTITRKGGPDEFDFSYSGYELRIVARHPNDDGVWLGDIGALRSVPEGVDGIVSPCRVGDVDLPARAEQIDVRLIDQPGVNENLDFVLLTVRLVAQLRREGRTVLIHCVQAQSRTPAVAALYDARLRGIRIGIGIDEALADVRVARPQRCRDDYLRDRDLCRRPNRPSPSGAESCLEIDHVQDGRWRPRESICFTR